MLTESETKTKWCPLVRLKDVRTGSGPAFNRTNGDTDPRLTPFLYCLGSDCMAWRWESQQPAHAAVEGRKGYCAAFGEAK